MVDPGKPKSMQAAPPQRLQWVLETRHYLWIATLVGACALLLSIMIEEIKDSTDRVLFPRKRLWIGRLGRTVHEFGMAAAIGGVIGLCFEMGLRYFQEDQADTQKEALQRDVFRYVLGYNVDRAVWDEVYDSVFRSGLIRENWSVAYQFSQVDGLPGHVKLRVSVFYRLRNEDREPVDHSLRHSFFDVVPAQKGGRFVSLRVEDSREAKIRALPEPARGGRAPKPPLLDLDQDALQSCTTDKIEQFTKGMVHILKTKDFVRIPRGEAVDVSYVYELVRQEASTITLYTLQAAKGVKVTAATCSEKCRNLHFELDSAHRVEPERLTKDVPECMLHEWRINAAVLPGQGIELFWSPAKDPKSAGDKPRADEPGKEQVPNK
jgi:hypothetical protein